MALNLASDVGWMANARRFGVAAVLSVAVLAPLDMSAQSQTNATPDRTSTVVKDAEATAGPAIASTSVIVVYLYDAAGGTYRERDGDGCPQTVKSLGAHRHREDGQGRHGRAVRHTGPVLQSPHF